MTQRQTGQHSKDRHLRAAAQACGCPLPVNYPHTTLDRHTQPGKAALLYVFHGAESAYTSQPGLAAPVDQWYPLLTFTVTRAIARLFFAAVCGHCLHLAHAGAHAAMVTTMQKARNMSFWLSSACL